MRHIPLLLVQRPALKLDFSQESLDSRVTYAGGANATRVNIAESVVAATCPRFDYALTGGLLVEEARTNSIRNNTMDGASAGTPGTAPTYWFISPYSGVSSSVIGAGTEGGIPYLDVRFFGTPTGTNNCVVGFEQSTGIDAATGQTWTGAMYIRLVGGSLSNISGLTQLIAENTAAGAFVAAGTFALTSPTSAALIDQRQSNTRTLAGGGTVGKVQPLLWVGVTNGQAIDVTLRLGLPTLEQGANALSPVLTTNAAVARSADSAIISGADFTASHHPEAGSAVVEFDLLAVTGTRPIISFDDNSANNRIELYASGTDLKLLVVSGGVTQADLTLGTVAANTTYKAAFAWRANDFAACMTGGQLVTDTAGTVPTVDRLRLGSNQAGDYMNGHLKKLDRWNRRIQNDRLFRSV